LALTSTVVSRLQTTSAVFLLPAPVTERCVSCFRYWEVDVAWHGFCSASVRLDSFLCRCIKLGYAGQSAIVNDMFLAADDALFRERRKTKKKQKILNSVNYGNFEKSTRRMPILTRCSAIAERPRCKVRYSFRQSRRLELGDNILRTL